MDFQNDKNMKNKKDYDDKYIYSYSDKSKVTEKNVAKDKRKSKKLYILGLVVSIILGLMGSILLYAYNKLDSINYKSLGESGELLLSESDSTDLLQEPKVLNVIMFGVDRREQTDNHSRSDSTMLLSVDNRRKKIKLTSLMRDTWVKIPGHAQNRLNTAIAYGGEKLAIQTVQNTFGIKMDKYATVDFESFKKIVDIIGGIDLSLSAAEASYINGDLEYYRSPSPRLPVADGTYHLDGDKTLSYARARKVATPEGLHDDFARTYRQRRVLKIIVESMKKCNIAQILRIVDEAGPYIDTNLKKSEIITLSKNIMSYLNYQLEEFRLPTNDNVQNATKNGMAVLVIPDMSKAKYDLAKFIYEDTVQYK